MDYELIVLLLLGAGLYLFLGWRTRQVACKLVWFSNDFTGDACDEVESLRFAIAAMLFWPVLIIFLGD